MIKSKSIEINFSAMRNVRVDNGLRSNKVNSNTEQELKKPTK